MLARVYLALANGLSCYSEFHPASLVTYFNGSSIYMVQGPRKRDQRPAYTPHGVRDTLYTFTETQGCYAAAPTDRESNSRRTTSLSRVRRPIRPLCHGATGRGLIEAVDRTIVSAAAAAAAEAGLIASSGGGSLLASLQNCRWTGCRAYGCQSRGFPSNWASFRPRPWEN